MFDYRDLLIAAIILLIGYYIYNSNRNGKVILI